MITLERSAAISVLTAEVEDVHDPVRVEWTPARVRAWAAARAMLRHPAQQEAWEVVSGEVWRAVPLPVLDATVLAAAGMLVGTYLPGDVLDELVGPLRDAALTPALVALLSRSAA